MFFLLILGIVIICILSYYMFKKDLFAPAFIVSIVFFVSSICALFNYKIWDLQNYNKETVSIILTCLYVFCGVSFFVYRFVYSNQLQQNISKDNKVEKKEEKNSIIKKIKVFITNNRNKNNIIHLNKWVKALIISLFVFAIFINFCEVYRISHLTDNPETYSQMMEIYRKNVSYSVLDISVKTPILFNQITKIITAISYIYIYIIIRNMFNKDKLENNYTYFFTLILYLIYSLCSGGRMPVLKLIAYTAFMIFVFFNRKFEWKKNLNTKFLSIGAICLIIMFIGFYASKGIVGRTKKFDPMYYITMYTGGSLKLFDDYLENPASKIDIFGKETFYGINTFLGRLGLSDQNYIKHLEFRYAKNGQSLGNVYTPFRRYYADFGIIGAIILTATFAGIINFIYFNLKEKIAKRTDYNKDLWLVLYGIIIYCLFLYSIDDQFYGVILSVNYITQILVISLVYLLLVHLDLNKIIGCGEEKG